ncbi:hypothetical protein D3C85_1148750 [compost metagenome]
MYGTSHAGIEQCGRVAAVHGAKRIVVLRPWGALEHHAAHLESHRQEADQIADGDARQLAAQDIVKELRPGARAQLVARNQPHRRQLRTHTLLVGLPLGQHVFHAHLVSPVIAGIGPALRNDTRKPA